MAMELKIRWNGWSALTWYVCTCVYRVAYSEWMQDDVLKLFPDAAAAFEMEGESAMELEMDTSGSPPPNYNQACKYRYLCRCNNGRYSRLRWRRHRCGWKTTMATSTRLCLMKSLQMVTLIGLKSLMETDDLKVTNSHAHFHWHELWCSRPYAQYSNTWLWSGGVAAASAAIISPRACM